MTSKATLAGAVTLPLRNREVAPAAAEPDAESGEFPAWVSWSVMRFPGPFIQGLTLVDVLRSAPGHRVPRARAANKDTVAQVKEKVL